MGYRKFMPEAPKQERRKAGDAEAAKIIGSYKPLDAQKAFHTSTAKFRLYGGAMGGGKSRALCEGAVMDCITFPGNFVLICRKNLTALKNTTYLTLKNKSTLRELLDAGLVWENLGSRIFTFWNGSKIFYTGIEGAKLGDEPVFSGEYGAIYIDEAFELDKLQYTKLASRLRHSLPDKLPNGITGHYYDVNTKTGTKYPLYHISLASNPAQNWLKTEFILNNDGKTAFFPALPKDNIYNPESYNEDLEYSFRDDPAALQAYLHGSWDTVRAIDDLMTRADIEIGINAPGIGIGEKIVISCDPARFGNDSTVIQVWRDNVQERRESFQNEDTMAIVGWLLSLKRLAGGKETVFIVDETGLGGGVVDRLAELQENVVGINYASSPSADKIGKYANIRAEMYFETRDAIRGGKVKLLENQEDLFSQLCSIKYSRNSSDKLMIESKAILKKRLGKSPDDADCAAMACWYIYNNENMDNRFLKNVHTSAVSKRPEHWDAHNTAKTPAFMCE